MIIYDIIADTGLGPERVDIAATVDEAETIAATWKAHGAAWVSVTIRRV